MDLLPLQDGGGGHQVPVGRVGAAADADLVDRGPFHFHHRLDVVGAVGGRDQRLKVTEVDGDDLVVGFFSGGRHLLPRLAALLRLEEAVSDVVTGEDGGRRPQFGPHIGDDRPLRDREALDAAAEVFHDLADAALDGEAAENLEDDVLGADPGRERAFQVNADYFGSGEIEGFAGHGESDVETAGADGDHAETAGRRGVAVRSEERLTGHAETLEVQLVTDAVAGAGEVDAVAGRYRLEVAVVVGVHEPVLEGVVVNVAHGELGGDTIDVEGFELQVGHRAGGVLGECLVDLDGDLLSRAQGARDEVLLEDSICQGYFFRHFLPPAGLCRACFLRNMELNTCPDHLQYAYQ